LSKRKAYKIKALLQAERVARTLPTPKIDKTLKREGGGRSRTRQRLNLRKKKSTADEGWKTPRVGGDRGRSMGF